jgi:biopolymer transport protein ExbB/TolQ
MSLLLGSGIVYAFLESTLEGKIVLFTLFIGSIFSWSVMITKIRVLNFAKSQSERFMALFRRDREPLNIFETGLEFEGSPLFEIYKAGCEELSKFPTKDEAEDARLEAAELANERAADDFYAGDRDFTAPYEP